MAFNRGETVICEIEVTVTETGDLVDPATSMNITITNFHHGTEVNNQAMINDSTGKYHYDFNSAIGMPKGQYTVYYTDTEDEVDIFLSSSFREPLVIIS